MTQRILISIVVLLVIACVVVSLVLIPGAYLLASRSLGFVPNPVEATPTRTPVVMPTSTPGSNLSSDIERQMDQIQTEIMQIRGLTLDKPLIRDVLSTEELQERVMNEFFAEYTPEEAQQDAMIYHAWGLLEADYDILAMYKDLYSEQIAGYYDPETKEMYVVQGEGFFGNERMTYAHEFTHVLQDQNYDLREGLRVNEEYCEDNTEYCAAVTALVEGDATMAQYTWFWQFATSEDQSQVQESIETYESPVFDAAPAFIQQDLLFPYLNGLEFAQSLYDRGGWDAIDEAYANPPVTTEQILHPDRYPTDEPAAVELPDLQAILGDGWSELYVNVLGEWYTYLLLSQGIEPAAALPADTARSAAAGWGGDLYAAYLFEDTQQILLAHRWAWDTEVDAEEFWEAFNDYSSGRWGSPDNSSSDRLVWEETALGYVTAIFNNNEVVWLITPNATTADQILAEIPGFED